MRITKRIALENYCYEELEFESLEQYEQEYPKYVETHKRVKEKIAQQKKFNTEPFNS